MTVSLSFEKDIKPMFTKEDREAMLFTFDLWNHEDIVREISRIKPRVLDDRDMPPPAGWPEEWIQKFRQWCDEGMKP